MAVALAPAIVSGAAALGITVSTAAATTIASVGLYAGTAYAQYLITQAMTPKPKVGTKLQFEFGGDVAQSIILGEAETAGSLVYAGAWGPKNNKLVQVFCVSDMPSTELRPTIFVDGIKRTIDFGAPKMESGNLVGYATNARRYKGGNMQWVKMLDGTQTVADPYLRDKFAGADRPWRADMIGRGRTLMVVTTQFNKKEQNSIPMCRFRIRGIKLYNPKLDTTNGGSGSHRYDNQATYEWDDNAAVVAYNVVRGIFYGSEWMYGGRGWPAYCIDNNSVTASINAANDDISLKGGGTVKRFKVGGEISLDAAIFDTLDEIKAASNMRLSASGGIIYIDCGNLGAAEFVFTDGELYIIDATDSTITPSLESLFNTIIATYTEPNIGGELKAIKPKSDAGYIAADDGQILRATPSIRLCREQNQAQRVAKYMLNDNRRQVTRQAILGPDRREDLRAGQTLAFTSTRYQYTNKRFIVGDDIKFRNGLMLVELREADPNDNSWTPLTDEDDFIVGEAVRIEPPVNIVPLTVTATAIKKGSGTNVKPALKVQWPTTIEDLDGKRMQIQVRLLDSTEIMVTKTVDFDGDDVTNFAMISDGILKNEAYQVRAKVIPVADWMATDWSDWAATSSYPGGLTYVLASNLDGVDETPPTTLLAPVTTLRTRRHRDGKIRQRLVINLNGSEPARPATESYRIRVFDSDDNATENFRTDEFPFTVEVQTAHTYTVRILPISRFGVVGALSPLSTFSGFSMPVPKKTTADGAVPAVTSLSVTAGHRRNDVEWAEVDTSTFPDWSYTLLERDNSAAFSGGNYKRWKLKTNKLADVGLGNADTKHYRATHYDTNDNPGTVSSPINTSTPRLDTDDYGQWSITKDKIRKKDLVLTAESSVDYEKIYTTSTQDVVNNAFELGKPLKVTNLLPSRIDVSVNLVVTVGSWGMSEYYVKSTSQVLVVLVPTVGKKKTLIRLKTNDGKPQQKIVDLDFSYPAKEGLEFKLYIKSVGKLAPGVKRSAMAFVSGTVGLKVNRVE